MVFSLRAAQSRNSAKRVSVVLTTYMQVTFGTGFVSVAQNILYNLMNLRLEAASSGELKSDSESSRQLVAASGQSLSRSQTPLPPSEVRNLETTDGSNLEGNHNNNSFWRRHSLQLVKFPFIGAVVPGVISGSRYGSAMSQEGTAETVMRLRCVWISLIIFFLEVESGTVLIGFC